jgi:hypothetical protein
MGQVGLTLYTSPILLALFPSLTPRISLDPAGQSDEPSGLRFPSAEVVVSHDI